MQNYALDKPKTNFRVSINFYCVFITFASYTVMPDGK